MKRSNEILSLVKGRGWEVSHTKNGHYKLTKPGCQPVFTSTSVSDRRALKNIDCMIRRAERGMVT